jgi:adenylate kinase
MKRRIILLGPPGSGKGTVAVRLHQEFGLDHVSSGHLLRREVEKVSAIGQRARLFLEKGDLVPDGIMLQLMGEWVKSAPENDGFLLDGFPRTLSQAKALDQWLAVRNAPVEAVILYAGDLKLILDRITGRRSCPKCGRVYHIYSAPPKVAGLCEDCLIALIQRPDDNEAVVRKRFEIYGRHAKPLANYYERQGKLTVVDAALLPDERFAKTVAALN